MGNVEGSARNNGFNWYSTAEQTARNVDLKDKNIIVTGGNTGIGKETVRVLAKHGAHVFLASRDEKRGQAAIDDLKSENSEYNVELLKLDLASLESIKQAAQEFEKKNIPLHVLVCNAGVMATPYSETSDGFELQFGTNHLGHFYFTKLLLPSLIKAQPSRVVVLSSTAHRGARSQINFDDLSGKNTWYTGFLGKWTAYGQAKAANILFANELNRRYQNQGVYAFSCHPGAISTELQRHVSWLEYVTLKGAEKLGLFKSVPQGAATSVYLATAPELLEEKEKYAGFYFSDSNKAVPLPFTLDEKIAARLWEVSEQLINEKINKN